MDGDTDKRIERLENQVVALNRLLCQSLAIIIKDSCLEPDQRQAKDRVEQLLQTLKSIKAPRR